MFVVIIFFYSLQFLSAQVFLKYGTTCDHSYTLITDKLIKKQFLTGLKIQQQMTIIQTNIVFCFF